MNSIVTSDLFPGGTVIVAYKGKSLGGTKMMPQWQVKPLINENRFFRTKKGISSRLAVTNSITMEFEAIDPQHLNNTEHLYSPNDFDSSPGELSFIPLDPEKQVAYNFPMATLTAKSDMDDSKSTLWKFEILFDHNGVFMEEFKTNV